MAVRKSFSATTKLILSSDPPWPERRWRVRYMVPTGDGDWRAMTWGAHAKE